jgi:hypothetical protein
MDKKAEPSGPPSAPEILFDRFDNVLDVIFRIAEYRHRLVHVDRGL